MSNEEEMAPEERDRDDQRHGGMDVEAVLSKQPVVTCCGSALEVRRGECLQMRLTGSRLWKALTPCPGVCNTFRKNRRFFIREGAQ